MKQLISRWLTMVVLSLSGGIIFLLPFLFEIYYRPMGDAMDLTNTELGALFSVFGLTSMICYFPGGWLADRISARKLMTASLLLTGIAGLWFATLPSYSIVVAIHAFWGFSITLLFWAAMIRATRNWAPADEQGKAFGVLETIRGVGEAGLSSILLVIFAWLGSTDQALSSVINILSLVIIGLGIASWFAIDDTSRENDGDSAPRKVGWHEIVAVLKMPVLWQITVVVICAYCAYWGSFQFTPYATDVFLTTAVVAGAISIGRMWLKPLTALFAGLLADKFGIARTVSVLLAILVVSFGVFGVIPGNPSLLAVMMVNLAIAAIAVFALRGIYFALMEEGGIPLAVTGTAGGIISAIGFTPDIFMPYFFGVVTDAYPGALGYRYFYLGVSAICGIGLGAALWIYFKRVKPLKAGRDTN